MTGYTDSPDFPTQNPYQGAYNGGFRDAFVTKLSSSGNNLVYSTYLGGSSGDGGEGIAVDTDGLASVTGSTSSTDFPTLTPYQAAKQEFSDACVTKLSGEGNNLIYSTYLGGNSSDGGIDIALDDAGAMYVTGQTYSTNFPLFNHFQTSQLYYDVFVTKFSNVDNSLIFST